MMRYMKTVVLYSSKHDTTYSIAKHISLALDADVCTVDEFDTETLNSFDAIVLGGPIYGGTLYGPIDIFCRNNLEELLTKKVALFVCGLSSSSSKQQHLLQSAFLRPLLAHAVCAEFVGGAVNLSKLSTSEKLLIKTMMKIDHDLTAIDQPAIDRLIDSLQSSNK